MASVAAAAREQRSEPYTKIDGSNPSQVRLSMGSISVGRHRLTRQLGSLFDAIAQTLNLGDEIDEIRELLDADRRDMPEICSRE